LSAERGIETRLGAARTRLALEHPFIGALVLHLPLAASRSGHCETLATDARAIYYNPEYVTGSTQAELRFLLAHEALHCALGQFARRGHRDRRRWDVACDHAVNLLLIEEGLAPVPGALASAEFRGLAAEEIYPLVPHDPAERTLDRHLFEGYADAGPDGAAARTASAPRGHLAVPRWLAGASWDDAGSEPHAPGGVGEPAPGVPDAAALARLWRGRMVAAAQQARLAGRMPASWLRRIDRLAAPQLPWQFLLARHLASALRDDYSFQRPSRREGDAILPRLAGGALELCVALDTSGSIGAEDLAQFGAALDALKGQVRAAVTVLACDERLADDGPWTYQPWQPIVLPPAIGGGGGTRFVPVFDWIAAGRCVPDLLIYFTDADGEFPARAPAFPVLWLVKGGRPVPWGERIQLN